MTTEQFETMVKKGASSLARWAICEDVDEAETTEELKAAGYGIGLISKAFDIAINSEGYYSKIETYLRYLLDEWNPIRGQV